MGYYCTPQFAEAWPDRDIYKKRWQHWPREIPDAFVRDFGEWCAEHGVKGKYSVVPYPACVGWLDRELPGWSRRELVSSLRLVRDLMLPNWDIHPEMITHTRIIDLRTGRPLQEISPATMENSFPREKKSVDFLASYLAYALQILKNCDLPCEGITTPGGFGSLVKSELSLAVHEAVRDVYGVDLPHYFKYVVGSGIDTEPKVEHVRGLGTNDVRATVNVPAGTGDWFGGWQGDRPPEGDRYANRDATRGRLVDLIKAGKPAVLLCHWPGMYSQGSELGFQHFKNVVRALADRYADQTIWLKVSEIARYWGAKELTHFTRRDQTLTLEAPFACPQFTIQVLPQRGDNAQVSAVSIKYGNETQPLNEATAPAQLRAQTWLRQGQDTFICFDMRKGKTVIELS